MLKKVDKVMLKAFFMPLIITFTLTTFIFMMQFLWKYIDDFVGKGLDNSLLLKLVALFSLTIIPMALPLAILLASNMVLGGMGENNELTAYKSSGVSLFRINLSLIILTIGLAIGAFYFSNRILPVISLKFYSLLYDIRKQKPALDIKEGVFYRGISNFAIKIKKKDADNKTLYGITIYDHTAGKGNDNILMAKKGVLGLSKSATDLVLTLYDGVQYQEVQKRGQANPTIQFEQTILRFKKFRKVINLEEFKMKRTDQDLFKSNYVMLNTKQLQKEADSISKILEIDKTNFVTTNTLDYLPINTTIQDTNISKLVATKTIQLDSVFNKKISADIINNAISTIDNKINSIDYFMTDFKYKEENKARYMVEWYRKFSLSFACLILFFVGSSMGAIVRKGGFGMPILVSVLFFVLFHVLNVIGEKLAKQAVIPTFAGMWMSSIILLPISLLLTYKAMNDSVLFRGEWYRNIFSKINRKKVQK